MDSSLTTKREIRRFGAIGFFFFGSLCGLAVWREKELVIYLFGTLSVLGLSLLALPGPLSPIYRGWIRVAHFIGTTINAIVLSLVYYLVISPAGLMKRLIGGRPLPLKPDSRLNTYWVTRSEPAQPKERFRKRY